MRLRIFPYAVVENLKQRIPDNRDAYLGGKASGLLGSTPLAESKIEVDEPPQLELPTGDDLKDAANARMIFQWLHLLNPIQASDPRVWSYLTHAVYSDYTFRRWPIDKSADVATRIRERYFVEGQGLASLVRNAVARLWWFGYLTYDERASGDHFEFTDVLVSLQDIQVAFLERAIGRSRKILKTALKVWKERLQRGGEMKGRGRAIQIWARLIRLHGAVALLDALPERDLENLIRAKLAIAFNEEWPDEIQEDEGVEA